MMKSSNWYYLMIEVIGDILRNVDGITLEIYVGTDIGSLDWSVDGSSYGNLEGLFTLDSMGSTDGKLLGIIIGKLDGIMIGGRGGNGEGLQHIDLKWGQ